MGGELCGVGGSESGVLFEVLDDLRDVLFGQGEVRRFEAVNGLLILVGDDDVDDYELGAGVEGGDTGLRWLRGGGSVGLACGACAEANVARIRAVKAGQRRHLDKRSMVSPVERALVEHKRLQPSRAFFVRLALSGWRQVVASSGSEMVCFAMFWMDCS